MIAVNDLLKLAIEAHGGARRWEQIERFGVAASITGAIWTLKGHPGLLDGVVLAGETRDQRLIITPFPRPGQYATSAASDGASSCTCASPSPPRQVRSGRRRQPWWSGPDRDRP
jgi:hypothetical protein